MVVTGAAIAVTVVPPVRAVIEPEVTSPALLAPSPVSTPIDATPRQAQADPAWARRWYRPIRGEWPTFLWVVGLHLAGLVGVILLPLPPWEAFAIAGALLFLGGLGTTVAFHRAMCHKSFTLHPIIEQALIACAVANGSGNPENWVTMHRLHHRTSDRDDDISSPHHGGFWWAHLRWLWQAPRPPGLVYADMRQPRYLVWNRLQIPVLALSCFGGLGFLAVADATTALAAFLWIGPLRLLWALHTQCTVNSICHLGSLRAEGGSSRNVAWLALAHMGQGENWHANHHEDQLHHRLGRRWWQVDIGWWTIAGLAAVGLARDFRIDRRRPSVKETP